MPTTTKPTRSSTTTPFHSQPATVGATARDAERRLVRGRPKKTEIKEVRQTALFTPSEWEKVEQVLPEGAHPGPWLSKIALQHASVGPHATVVDKSMIGTENVRARLLTKAPCGPWAEAIEHAGEFVLSSDIADELQVRPHDVLVRAVGESMEGAGILDGALVVMRPLPEHRVPRNGEIALVEVTREDGETFGTIKHWHSGGPGQPPRLTDGQGDEFPLPEGVTSVRPIAVADGVIARL